MFTGKFNTLRWSLYAYMSGWVAKSRKCDLYLSLPWQTLIVYSKIITKWFFRFSAFNFKHFWRQAISLAACLAMFQRYFRLEPQKFLFSFLSFALVYPWNPLVYKKNSSRKDWLFLYPLRNCHLVWPLLVRSLEGKVYVAMSENCILTIIIIIRPL